VRVSRSVEYRTRPRAPHFRDSLGSVKQMTGPRMVALHRSQKLDGHCQDRVTLTFSKSVRWFSIKGLLCLNQYKLLGTVGICASYHFDNKSSIFCRILEGNLNDRRIF
jgi:hypothetical protein